jgi:NDP-4-keto-2,6-dideoxyhexose 3-C-methyltransferase
VNYSTVHACRVCKSHDLRHMFSLGEQRLNGFLLPEAPPRPIVPLSFVWCPECHCLQQKHSANPSLLHQGGYWYRSGVSATMREALADVVSAAGQRTTLEDKDVVIDLGSNDATLLRLYGRHLVRVGVEPMADSFREARQGISLLIPHAWGEPEALHAYKNALGDRKAKVVTALGMLYSVENPDIFVRDVAEVLHDDGVFIVQLMTLPDMLSTGDIGNLCHEHLVFFSLSSLCRLMNRHGLKVYAAEKNAVNGGSTRLYVSRKPQASRASFDTLENVRELLVSTQSFPQEALSNLNLATKMVYAELREGRRVAVYGASTKGNTILQCMGLNKSHLACAADRDPTKWELVMSGGSVPIVSEEEALKKTDTFLVLPYAFRKEILARLKALGWRGRGIFPLPKAEVVDV